MRDVENHTMVGRPIAYIYFEFFLRVDLLYLILLSNMGRVQCHCKHPAVVDIFVINI